MQAAGPYVGYPDAEEPGEALDVRLAQDMRGQVVAPVVVRVGRRLAGLEV